MITILLTIGIAVVLWVIISLLLVVGAQNKQKKRISHERESQPETQLAQRVESVPEPPLSQRVFDEEAEKFEKIEEAIEETFADCEHEGHIGRRSALRERDHTQWQSRIEEVPGVLGWVLLRGDGAVVDASEESDLEEMGLRLSRMLRTIGHTMEDLGLAPLQIMGWEGTQGSIVVALPKEQLELDAYLVLFMEMKSFTHNVHELLSELHWESILKGEQVI